jgi:hypothetical protein
MLELEERRERLDERRQIRKQMTLDNTERMLRILAQVNPRGVDERTLLQIEDLTKNIMLPAAIAPPPRHLLLTTSEEEGEGEINNHKKDNNNDAISVSLIVSEMGLSASKKQLQAIGKKMAAQYRETYNKEPSKHRQFVDGNVIAVNSYTECDKPMMVSVIREVLES